MTIYPITNEEIDAHKTAAGGWTRATLARWGVPWPAPKGWRKTIVECGFPYDPALNTHGGRKAEEFRVSEERLQQIMDDSKPDLIDGEAFECDGELDIDAATLLRKVVSAVISHGQGHILHEYPDVLAFFGSRIPQREEVAHQHNLDERAFDAADQWPNRRKA